MAFFFLVNNAEPVLFVKGHHEVGERLVGDARPELTVQRVNGCLSERVAVDMLDGLVQERRFEERALDVLRVIW